MKNLAVLTALGALATASPALACLPPLPVSASEQAEAQWERQDLAWSQAATVAEMEVGRVDYLTPADLPPGAMRQIRVEFRPLRALRGPLPEAPVEVLYQDVCGFAPSFPLVEGTRLVVYSREASIRRPEDLFDLIPESDIVHSGTLEGLAAD